MLKKKRVFALVLILVFLLGMLIPAYGDQLSEQQQKLQDLNQQISRQKSNLKTSKNKEKSILGNIGQLERDMDKTQHEIVTITDQVGYLENKITVTRDEIKIIEDDLEEQKETLAERLVFIYEEGDISYLEVLLSAEDMQDFLTRYDLLNMIVKQDQGLIESISAQQEQLQAKKKELERQQSELESVRENEEKKKDLLAGQVDDKKQILSTVQQERKQYEKAVAELEQSSKQIEAMIRQAQGGNKASIGTGTYTWPAPGYATITSAYGMRFHPVLKVNKLHTGVDIGAPMGATIVAADGGKVMYSGSMGGYGQVIVIDHGAGLSTLYAHQSQRLVSVGTSVSKGQTIGKVGSTGWSTGPHLHFEVRVNGSPVNPRGYI